MILWLCLIVVAWQVLAFAVWAGPLIMEWCVPVGTFPRHLTRGDRHRTAVLADGTSFTVWTWPDPRLCVLGAWPVTTGEYEQIRARWLEAHGSPAMRHRNPLILPPEHEGEWD